MPDVYAFFWAGHTRAGGRIHAVDQRNGTAICGTPVLANGNRLSGADYLCERCKGAIDGRLRDAAPALLDACAFALNEALAYAGEETEDDTPNGEIIRKLRMAVQAVAGSDAYAHRLFRAMGAQP